MAGEVTLAGWGVGVGVDALGATVEVEATFPIQTLEVAAFAVWAAAF